jgi:acetyl esterase
LLWPIKPEGEVGGCHSYGRKLFAGRREGHFGPLDGTIHDFVLLNGISETPAVRSAITLANDTLRNALHK